MSEKKDQPKFPTYKGKPLVRCGDVIYYGSMKDKYVVKLEIKSKKKVKDMDVADRVTSQWTLRMHGLPGRWRNNDGDKSRMENRMSVVPSGFLSLFRCPIWAVKPPVTIADPLFPSSSVPPLPRNHTDCGISR